MQEMFRLKIESGRKTTVPQHLLNELKLRKGDELRVITENGKVLRVEPYYEGEPPKKMSESASAVRARIEAIQRGAHDSEEKLLQVLNTDTAASAVAFD